MLMGAGWSRNWADEWRWKFDSPNDKLRLNKLRLKDEELTNGPGRMLRPNSANERPHYADSAAEANKSST
jgi:hypothetical protein